MEWVLISILFPKEGPALSKSSAHQILTGVRPLTQDLEKADVSED